LEKAKEEKKDRALKEMALATEIATLKEQLETLQGERHIK
jgi:hypothetical protein